MSIIHGSRGLIYFVHQFKPRFIEAGLLADAEMTRAVTAINKRIHSLAPVINSPPPDAAATVKSSNQKVPIAIMLKRHGGATYLFAVAMRDGKTSGSFHVPGAGEAVAEVLDENRTIRITEGKFTDAFKGYDVHLYKVR